MKKDLSKHSIPYWIRASISASNFFWQSTHFHVLHIVGNQNCSPLLFINSTAPLRWHSRFIVKPHPRGDYSITVETSRQPSLCSGCCHLNGCDRSSPFPLNYTRRVKPGNGREPLRLRLCFPGWTPPGRIRGGRGGNWSLGEWSKEVVWRTSEMTAYTDREEVRELKRLATTQAQRLRHEKRWAHWPAMRQLQMLNNPVPGQARLPGF